MNLGQQMTFLGLAALAYYAVMLGTGMVGTEVMPQFVVSAVLFLSSGRMMRRASVKKNRGKEQEEDEDKPRKEPNWELRTQILNWVMATLILSVLGLWVMKPVGVSFMELLPF
ncbi:MAG: hypothetical protein C0622_02975 [Desulfuromonas sp.]|nr:MAG: hypothetical protein C0622_02975 [Desulfuromonas sp.]